MLCNHCGYWNSEEESRCSHCGRRPERSSREERRREPVAVGASAVLPPLSSGDRREMPPPLPPWKRQLSLKLDTYRSRQQAREEAETTEPKEAPEKKPKVQRVATVRPPPVWRNKVIAFQPPEGTDDGPETKIGLGEALPSPSPAPHWRKIERSRPKLPPLVRNGGTNAAAAKDLFVEERPAPPTTPKPVQQSKAQNRTAPVQARLIAGVLDMAVVLVALGVFIGVFHRIGGDLETGAESFRTIFFVFLGLLFFYWTFYLRYIGETAGMTWMRLRVVTFDGRAPSTVQKWVRTAGTILSCCAAGLGFFWALADEEKLTWHDRMSRTYITDAPDQVAASQPTVRLERPLARPLPRAARRA